jgi:hypothetical protein
MLVFFIESAKIQILVESAKFFYPQPYNHTTTDNRQTFITNVKIADSQPVNNLPNPTVV